MAFWMDWELWEKLSAVLAMLIALTLFCAFCVLGWNRWMMSKHAATEAKEREEQAEVYPMLHKDDIPFGARALERGVVVEGIWISEPNTPTQSPCQPATPVPSRPVSPAPRSTHRAVDTLRSSVGSQRSMISPKPMPPAARREVVSELDLASAGFTYENHRPGGIYSGASLPINATAMRMSPAREESLIGMKDTAGNEKRASFHKRIFGKTSDSDTKDAKDKDYRVGLDGTDDDENYVPALSDAASILSSESKRSSGPLRRLRRRSSEEFRRRMSQIFNDNIQIGLPDDQLEFNPALRQYQKRVRRSLLRPFRPWLNAPENQ
ncbi:hypothetical protein E8E15_005967 [Penicillium rubens]|uniref:Pc16g07380 protein n=2 Tax=Penicillium chrysogenum species complex TaxID=254878 RepID=B6H7K9_PENRW|nr:uncharacterized protein N7525_011138 [Penicillium rubens]KZN83938.1 hypothetical protein EN45_110560 [Penicillium chrysogenum]CAP93408.1 Pc16g07380 [Penicillium rubens Wisconsin 54-1255]KAF3014363.1 hypothetical protein E8E15_005967 [Penicillium rubens]KAJ5036802.1 hypothetical protein NUH16_004682 [Penicillium rubens]KAJ5821854.1 hypothetical protein N7525_011138 [Penicillium rubens]